MRIWSVHPKYLDVKGLVALWCETLLAKNVLEGNTKGYKNHPQLIRFKNSESPVDSINHYLKAVYEESLKRGYHFDKSKFTVKGTAVKLNVTTGQLEYEVKHLLKKLQERDKAKYAVLSKEDEVEIHPIFYKIDGTVEDWEIV